MTVIIISPPTLSSSSLLINDQQDHHHHLLSAMYLDASSGSGCLATAVSTTALLSSSSSLVTPPSLLSPTDDSAVVLPRFMTLPVGGATTAGRRRCRRHVERASDVGGSSKSAVLLDSFYKHLSQPVRFFISGNIGNLIFFGLERLVHCILSQRVEAAAAAAKQDELVWWAAWSDSISFFSAYMLHVPAQHYFYALLVYGLDSINTRTKYWTTLSGLYSAYMVSSVGSTALNAALLRHPWFAADDRRRSLAFFITISTFACLNYVVLGYIVNKSSNEKKNNNTTSSINQKIPRGGGSSSLVWFDDGATTGRLPFQRRQRHHLDRQENRPKQKQQRGAVTPTTYRDLISGALLAFLASATSLGNLVSYNVDTNNEALQAM